MKAFAMVLVFSLVSGASLVGAPDPDIFDGRVTSSSESGGASSSTSEASSAEDEADAQASGGGSGSAQSSGSEANAQSGGSDSGATSSGVGAVAGEESSGASSGSGSGRDFSSIGGVGAGSAAEVLDINSSKASREPSGGFASPAIPDERVSADTSPSQDIGAGSGSGGSQTIPSVPKGDLGDAIPTGL